MEYLSLNYHEDMSLIMLHNQHGPIVIVARKNRDNRKWYVNTEDLEKTIISEIREELCSLLTVALSNGSPDTEDLNIILNELRSERGV